ncbi:aminotransferase class I/II-fold pyridoxal phosphate-dependent enzyme [Leptospira langatensis]|uniref:aminotransferase class I/II-fold pyridoxal phosphate-dependent enzyme n=1 Tax=Leptospira langatensis TaxID=2484983 RepID=UPI001FEA435E|nr:8-amino-7-oxononanoate synthase [Leptospira langatensis]
MDPPSGLDLCSNDYLGLSQNLKLQEALKEGIDLYGAGSTASRLVRGHRTVFEELESEFSNWVHSESSLFLANGYAANVGTISCVADPSYMIFCDRKNHASLMDGVRLSGGKKIYYRHCDMEHLEDLLKKYSGHANKMIVTESIFSMDGDASDLPALLSLKEKYGCLLYLDEAHSIGVFGEKGAGLSSAQVPSEISNIDFRMSSFGKALGLEGAMVSTSADARKYLLHSARTFVFSTAPMPAIAHAGLTSVQLVQEMNEERKKVLALAEHLRSSLQAIGKDTGNSSSQIVPILLGSEAHALDLADKLAGEGFQAKAIRPPTVDVSRIRVSINAKVEKNDLDRFIRIIQEN